MAPHLDFEWLTSLTTPAEKEDNLREIFTRLGMEFNLGYFEGPLGGVRASSSVYAESALSFNEIYNIIVYRIMPFAWRHPVTGCIFIDWRRNEYIRSTLGARHYLMHRMIVACRGGQQAYISTMFSSRLYCSSSHLCAIKSCLGHVIRETNKVNAKRKSFLCCQRGVDECTVYSRFNSQPNGTPCHVGPEIAAILRGDPEDVTYERVADVVNLQEFLKLPLEVVTGGPVRQPYLHRSPDPTPVFDEDSNDSGLGAELPIIEEEHEVEEEREDEEEYEDEIQMNVPQNPQQHEVEEDREDEGEHEDEIQMNVPQTLEQLTEIAKCNSPEMAGQQHINQNHPYANPHVRRPVKVLLTGVTFPHNARIFTFPHNVRRFKLKSFSKEKQSDQTAGAGPTTSQVQFPTNPGQQPPIVYHTFFSRDVLEFQRRLDDMQVALESYKREKARERSQQDEDYVKNLKDSLM